MFSMRGVLGASRAPGGRNQVPGPGPGRSATWSGRSTRQSPRIALPHQPLGCVTGVVLPQCATAPPHCYSPPQQPAWPGPWPSRLSLPLSGSRPSQSRSLAPHPPLGVTTGVVLSQSPGVCSTLPTAQCDSHHNNLVTKVGGLGLRLSLGPESLARAASASQSLGGWV